MSSSERSLELSWSLSQERTIHQRVREKFETKLRSWQRRQACKPKTFSAVIIICFAAVVACVLGIRYDAKKSHLNESIMVAESTTAYQAGVRIRWSVPVVP